MPYSDTLRSNGERESPRNSCWHLFKGEEGRLYARVLRLKIKWNMRNHLGNREQPLRLGREVGVVHVRSLPGTPGDILLPLLHDASLCRKLERSTQKRFVS